MSKEVIRRCKKCGANTFHKIVKDTETKIKFRCGMCGDVFEVKKEKKKKSSDKKVKDFLPEQLKVKDKYKESE